LRGRAAIPAPADAAPRLQAISTRLEGAMLAVLLDVSEPVPYATTQPDPLTLIVALRNVSAAGVANHFATGNYEPISAVTVEDSVGPDRVATARVRVRLTQAVAFRVRSSRNVIRVEIDRPVQAAAKRAAMLGKPAPAAKQPELSVTAAAPGKPAATASTPAPPPAPAAKPPADVPSSAVTGQPERTMPLVSPSGNAVEKPEPPKPDVQQAETPKVDPSPASPAPARNAETVAPARSIAAAATSAQQTGGAAQQAGTALSQLPPPAAPPLILGMQQRGDKQYTGHPISMDFAGDDLRSVLRMFGEISGLNILIDDAVKGSVDMSLRDVPWDQAFETILRSKQLGWTLEGNIIRIVPLSVLADEEKQRRTLAEEQALGGDLGTITRTLSYVKADEMKGLLEKGAITKRGQVQVYTLTNTLIVRDLPAALQTADDLIRALDQPQPQVEIEARIVQTTRTFARQLGAQLGFLGRATPELGNTLPLAFPNSITAGGRTTATQGAGAVGSAVNMGVTGATSAVGLTLGAINGAFNIDVALSALESSGQGRLLSAPRVFAQNNVEAEMTQGVQIPIPTIANNTVTVQFKDAALTLKVTPQINADNTVILSIHLENAAPDFTRSVNNIPPIDTQRAITQLMVRDGQTAVLGGIYVSQEQAQNDKTPGLGKIPILGWLFRKDTVTEETRELLIFITPKIVK
jgi:type IV pilus assembly protein PilQ